MSNRTLVAAILLGLAALGGATAASRRLRQKPIPLWLAAGHGAIGVVGLAVLASFVADLLSVAGTRAAIGFVPVALGVLILAGLGGLGLLSFRIRRQPIPVSWLALHALVAVAGYLGLVLGIVTGQ